MPEAPSLFPYSYTPDPPKKPPIKVSCGIGDSDGFPAFDVDSDTYATKDDLKWNFLITGGAEFHMPLTVFQVTPGGVADKAGIRLGDIILEINEQDATQLTLSQAHEKINAAPKKIQFLVKSMDDEENLDGIEPSEERCVVLRVPKPMEPLKEFTPTPLLGSRCWHPIMWNEPPPPPKPKKKKTKTEIDEEGNEVVIELSEDESSEDEDEKELPHHRIIQNIRRFFSEVGENHELKNRIIEDMLLALPTASKLEAKSIEARLREMQRKLSEIAEIPKILSSTLATVSQTFDKLVPGGGNESIVDQQQIQRKYSYDEDAIDYALQDDDNVEYYDDEDSSECDEDACSVDETKETDDGDDGDGRATISVYGACKDLAKKLALRDLTPESDYASTESENIENDGNDDNDEDDEEGEYAIERGVVYSDYDDDNIDDDEENETRVFQLRIDNNPLEAAADEDEEEEEEDEEDEDFLTTSFTWRLRKVPKLLLNDEPTDGHSVEAAVVEQRHENVYENEQQNEQYKNNDGPNNNDKIEVDKDEKDEEEEVVVIRHIPQTVEPLKNIFQPQNAEKDEKLGPLERAWPWADRTKIIYKQSTCHLVPRRPLGIIEKSKQLLAKQNLFDKLQKR